MTESLNQGLRECYRYIGSHNDQGQSIFVDSPKLLFNEAPGLGATGRSYCIDKIPAPLTNDQDLKSYLSKDTQGNPASHAGRNLTIPSGANLVVCNFAPGAMSQMHRTVSIDFSICIEGDIEMEMDNGDKRRLGPGDHVIQRATMHRWRNLSEEKPARLIAVLLDADAIEVGGKQIEEDHVAGTGNKKADGGRY